MSIFVLSILGNFEASSEIAKNVSNMIARAKRVAIPSHLHNSALNHVRILRNDTARGLELLTPQFSPGRLRSEANEGRANTTSGPFKTADPSGSRYVVVPARSFVVYSVLQYRKVESGARLRASRANSAVFSSTRSRCFLRISLSPLSRTPCIPMPCVTVLPEQAGIYVNTNRYRYKRPSKVERAT